MSFENETERRPLWADALGDMAALCLLPKCQEKKSPLFTTCQERLCLLLAASVQALHPVHAFESAPFRYFPDEIVEMVGRYLCHSFSSDMQPLTRVLQFKEDVTTGNLNCIVSRLPDNQHMSQSILNACASSIDNIVLPSGGCLPFKKFRNNSIFEVDMSQEELGAAGGIMLAESLKMNTSVTQVGFALMLLNSTSAG